MGCRGDVILQRLGDFLHAGMERPLRRGQLLARDRPVRRLVARGRGGDNLPHVLLPQLPFGGGREPCLGLAQAHKEKRAPQER